MAVVECFCRDRGCMTCCPETSIEIIDCNGAASSYETTPGPEESLKTDGQQLENVSVIQREFYLQIPTGTPTPARGSFINHDGNQYRLTEFFRYCEMACLNAVRVYYPCTETVTVYRCHRGDLCDHLRDPEHLGEVEVHIHYGTIADSAADDNMQLNKRFRVYVVGAIPFDCWEVGHSILTADGKSFKVIDQKNGDLFDRPAYLEVEETDGCCV